ncbi:MAG: Riboflavin transport system permease protein RibX [Alphaproteobacteria bacterium]|nr:MAG: Riboflavin transport system permease protein RibX [Alphaproteobacteria bacterium]
MRYLIPFLLGLALLGLWEFWVSAADVPVFILPAPSAIAAAMADNFGALMAALWVTMTVTLSAFFWAVVSAVALAILFTRARLIEMALYPYVITLQVTPVVAIAPLILIWVGFDNVSRALVMIAWIVAFFPMLTNTVQGLRSVDPQLHDMMTLAGASWWQRLLYLELPAALPSMLTGAKISGGLALIGAVVAEFVAGSGASTGLAWRIIEAGNRLEIATMFASLVLLSALGILLFYLLSFCEWLVLHKWHESFRRG